MVEADFSGNFLNSENCKDEDIGVILTEGEYKEMKKRLFPGLRIMPKSNTFY